MKSNSCVQDLRLYANSPRTHSKKHLRQIAASIEKCGFRNLIDDMNQIFAGHARVEVAKPLGIQGKKIRVFERPNEFVLIPASLAISGRSGSVTPPVLNESPSKYFELRRSPSSPPPDK